MGNSLLDAVNTLGPSIAARSNEIEEARRVPIDIVDQLRPTGVFRMFVPDDLGGPGLTAWESLEVLEGLGYHDGATAWCAMIGSTTSLMASSLPEPYAQEIFGDHDTIGGGFAMPVGRAVAVDGGLRVSGRWAWGSGTQHCNWVGGGCLVVDDEGTPSPRDDGLAVVFAFVPADEVTFIDNWHVSGLCGTGSGDYEVHDVFVPEGRWVQLGGGRPVRANALSRFSFFGLLACGVASCAMGIGRRSIDELTALAGDKTPQGSSRTLAQRPQVQADIAVAEARLGAAWLLLREAVTDSWRTAVAGDRPSVDQKRQLRLSATHAAQTAAEVTESMYKAGGGAAVYRTSPLQRTFRDAHVAIQHAMVAPRTFETHGRLRLGLETDTRQL
ncbi:MAG: acyl-CoA dehydrogenase family protein [Actinomycetota bacterium]